MTHNEDQIHYWNVVAGEQWVANQAKMDRLMAPMTEAFLRVAVPASGESVLDIGCGCGDVALRVAEKVGKGGRVTAVDVSKPMLAHARIRAAALPDDAASIDWIEADAMLQAFEPIYDLAVSRFGVMFFDDRRRAFANLRTAIKPGGRFAFLAWRARTEVEWMQKPLDWISPAVPMPASTDGEIGPFALADGEGTRELLADAGFRDVIAEPLDRELVIGASVDEAVTRFMDNGPAARELREAEEGVRAEAAGLIRAGAEKHAREDGRVVLRGACWLYRGKAES